MEFPRPLSKKASPGLPELEYLPMPEEVNLLDEAMR